MPSQLVTAQVTVTGTAQRLTSDTTLEVGEFIVRPHPSNSGIIEIGGSTLTLGQGYPLAAGEVFSFEYRNTAGATFFDRQPQDIYVVGTSGDKVAFIATGRS